MPFPEMVFARPCHIPSQGGKEAEEEHLGYPLTSPHSPSPVKPMYIQTHTKGWGGLRALNFKDQVHPLLTCTSSLSLHLS